MQSRKSVAVIGSGISGLGAAWLLSQGHNVTLFEVDHRIGGHSNTVEIPFSHAPVPVDTGFIVYNSASYPNLIALFGHLDVPTAATDMSFAVSLDQGAYEYAGSGLGTLFGQRRNIVRPSHWRMIADMVRFFREAPELLDVSSDEGVSLGRYLQDAGYSQAFIDRHILPMAAAIWSTPSHQVMEFPAAAFVRFFANHGLLQVRNRPEWRTVVGGSREYVRRLIDAMNAEVRTGCGVTRVRRHHDAVTISTGDSEQTFDACVIATHADDALTILDDPRPEERQILSAFRYSRNHTVLHTDAAVMPKRRSLWSSWNYRRMSENGNAPLSVTYWMNKLQPLGPSCPDLFVTLNPNGTVAETSIVSEFTYHHPIFNADALIAQRELWRLQGKQRTWFCGSYFGYGFHEDGLQSGLAVAEDLGGVRRPWRVENESSRIHLAPKHSALGEYHREAAE